MFDGAAPTTRFVILAAPRSGSNLLCTLLNSHPEILCHHEVFNPSGIFLALEYRDGALDLGSMEERDRAPSKFLERLWSTTVGHRSVGFKMTRGQSAEVLDSLLRDPGIRKVVLRRHNRIKTYVSTLIAQRLGQWEVYRGTDLCEPRPMVELNLADLREHIAENEAYYAGIDAVIRSTGQVKLEVAYEELFSSHEHARLLSFLNVSGASAPLVAGSIKQNPTDLRRLVTNFDELLDTVDDPDMVAELISSRD